MVRVLYVCSAGARRSAVLAAYSNHLSRRYGLPFEFVHAGIDASKRTRDLAKREKRLRAIARWSLGKRRELVDVLQQGMNDMHPRMGVLLLEDGIESVVNQRMMHFTPGMERDFSVVLAVDFLLSERIKGVSGGSNVYAVKEFLGFPEREWDICDIKRYMLPLTIYQMYKDAQLRDELKVLAREVFRKVYWAERK